MSSTFTKTALDSSRYQPPTSPDHHPMVIIIVIVSCGGFLLAFMASALLCCLKRRRNKRTREEIDILRADEHRKVKEEIIKGSHGTEAVLVTVEDDVHIDGNIIKKNSIEKLGDVSKGTLATERGQSKFEQQKRTPPPPPPPPSSRQA